MPESTIYNMCSLTLFLIHLYTIKIKFTRDLLRNIIRKLQKNSIARWMYKLL